MRGDHDDLEIFLEIRLIPSRIDQKLKNKGRIHGFLKGNFARRSWPIDAIVGAICKGRWSGSLGQRRSFGIGHELALILPRFSLQNSNDFRHDQSTIAPRSGHDWASIVLQILK